jgi:hypothetical protein
LKVAQGLSRVAEPVVAEMLVDELEIVRLSDRRRIASARVRQLARPTECITFDRPAIRCCKPIERQQLLHGYGNRVDRGREGDQL